jgi:hypothetical protein
MHIRRIGNNLCEQTLIEGLGYEAFLFLLVKLEVTPLMYIEGVLINLPKTKNSNLKLFTSASL